MRLTLSSPDEGWHGVSVRGWSLQASEPTDPIPPLATFAVIAYQRGSSPMHRLQDGHWTNDTVGPGDLTIMNAGAEAIWRWLAPLDDTHVYLTKDLMTATWREMYQQDVADVGLRDAIKVRDRAIFRAAMLIAAEAEHGLAGSRILVDSLATEMCVRLLRAHGDAILKEEYDGQALSSRQKYALKNYVNDNIAEDLSLQALADHIEVSRSNLARKFRAATGTSVHTFVLAQRVEHAETLLRRTRLPMHDIAAQSGLHRCEPHEPQLPPCRRDNSGSVPCLGLIPRHALVA